MVGRFMTACSSDQARLGRNVTRGVDPMAMTTKLVPFVLVSSLVACGGASSPATAPSPPAASAPAPDEEPDAISDELAALACTGYERCQEAARAWRDGERVGELAEDDHEVDPACLATVGRFSPEQVEALQVCFDQDCHGTCECVDWVERWGTTELECNYGDNPEDFAEMDDEG